MSRIVPLETLLGKVFYSVQVTPGKDAVVFIANDTSIYELTHEQDCCECVIVEDITGDLNDLAYGKYPY